jgi:hypothetical protein
MGSAEDGARDDVADLSDWPMARRILVQRQMRSEVVVINDVGGEDPAQVRLAEDDDMIEAFAADRADETFGVSVLLGRSRCRWSIPDAHGREASCYGVTVRGIPVADEVLGRLLPGEGFGDLRAIHSAVGLGVTLRDICRRRWCLRMTKTKSKLKPAVGTTRKSMASMPAT